MSLHASTRVVSMAILAAAIASTLVLADAATQDQPLTCDVAIAANEDFRVPRGMPHEDGTTAFTYGATGTPFVVVAGQKITFTLTLTFDPADDTTIKLWAIDDSCSGGTSSGAVLSSSVRELTSRLNQISYDGDAGTITVNGAQQKALAMGTPRFMWVEVWGGQSASSTASYSDTVDLLNPTSPVSR